MDFCNITYILCFAVSQIALNIYLFLGLFYSSAFPPTYFTIYNIIFCSSADVCIEIIFFFHLNGW